jgi:hypothetical protein
MDGSDKSVEKSNFKNLEILVTLSQNFLFLSH